MSVCVRSLALLGGLFSTLAALLFLGGEYCTAALGRTSDSAWTCSLQDGEVVSLWSLIDAPVVAAAALLIGGPVFVLIRRLGRRRDQCGAPRPPAARRRRADGA